MSGAVIYTRVSTEEQTRNLSLETQERTCREYCRHQGLEVLAVFEERGESAKTLDRTELKRLLDYCRTHKKQVGFVIVFDLKRFARNQNDHHALRAILTKLGVTLRSATEQISDDSTGRFIEGVLAATSQFDNEVRAERTVAGMNQALRRGRWPFKAPIGYKNTRAGDGHPIIVPDPLVAPLVREAFELAASRVRTHKEIALLLWEKGLRNTKGKPLTAQAFSHLLRNEIYSGAIRTKGKLSACLKGDFEPIVSEELFRRATLTLRGGKPESTPKRADDPDFPLRRFVRCGRCGKPLTGSWSKGRSKRYPNYHCKGSCKGAHIRKEVLERLFVDYLQRFQPKPEFLAAFNLVVCDVWKHRQSLTLDTASRTQEKLAQLKDKQKRLFECFVYDSAIDQATYDLERDHLAQEMALAEMELNDSKLEDLDLENLLALAEDLLGNLARLWPELPYDQKQKLQRALFPSGVPFLAGEFGTAEKCVLLKLIEDSQQPSSYLVDLSGVEPLTSSMRMTRSAN